MLLAWDFVTQGFASCHTLVLRDDMHVMRGARTTRGFDDFFYAFHIESYCNFVQGTHKVIRRLAAKSCRSANA
jgi:hypothetical protein